MVRSIPVMLLFLHLAIFPGRSQKFYFHHYLPRDGLPSDQTRMVTHDSIGFIWIATDGGLARFDGRHFLNFGRHTESVYIKAFAQASDGSLFFANDAGIFTIESLPDTAHITKIIAGSVTPSDSTVYYPNQLFCDRRDRLWISQPNGTIACYQQGRLKYFRFPPGHSTGYSDSGFSFAESADSTIFAGAKTGHLYFFNEEQSSFLPVDLPPFPEPLNILLISNDTLWAGGRTLLRAATGPQGQLSDPQYLNTGGRTLTSLAMETRGGSFWAGTQGAGLFRARLINNDIAFQEVFGSNDPHRIERLPFRNITHIFTDAEGGIWLSSRQGLGLLKERFFETVFGLANNNTYFISQGPDQSVLLSFGEVYSIYFDDTDFFSDPLPALDQGFITGITTVGSRLWMSTTDGEIFSYSSGSIRNRIDLSARGSGIFFIQGDRNGNIWFCQAPDESPIVGVGRITPDGQVRFYQEEAGLANRILVVRESARGILYAAGIGRDSYLYRYQPETEAFLNLSLPLAFNVSQGFEVHDIDIDSRGVIWMGTTDGLLRFDLERVQRIDLGEFTNTEVRALRAMPNGSLWLSTDTRGLLYYHDGQVVRFDEESGLPTRVTAYRCLVRDARGLLWVGTAEGTVYSRDLNPSPPVTATPMLLTLESAGRKLEPGSEKLVIPGGSGLNIRYATLAFPGDDIDYQYRLAGSADSSWSTPAAPTMLSLAGLEAGNYQLEIRAQQRGGYQWSPSLSIPFRIRERWYRTPWAIAILTLSAGAFLFQLIRLNVGRLRRRIRSLESRLADQEALLEQKSQALEAKSLDLQEATAELSSQQAELRTTFVNQQLLLELITRLPANATWDRIIGELAQTITATPGIDAFEFGCFQQEELLLRGYEKRRAVFTQRRLEFNEKRDLAVWALVHKEMVMIGDYRQEHSDYIDRNDHYRYHSVIALPFELAGRQQLVLMVYSLRKKAFEEQDLTILRILSSYLSAAIRVNLN